MFSQFYFQYSINEFFKSSLKLKYLSKKIIQFFTFSQFTRESAQKFRTHKSNSSILIYTSFPPQEIFIQHSQKRAKTSPKKESFFHSTAREQNLRVNSQFPLHKEQTINSHSSYFMPIRAMCLSSGYL